jgi:hypothetical protein
VVVGSNPTRSIESPVQIPKFNRKKRTTNDSSIEVGKVEISIQQTASRQTDYKMRDLYNRDGRLEYWLNRIDTDLNGSDKVDMFSLVKHMQDQERSALWITRCITILLIVRKQLQRAFIEASSEVLFQSCIWKQQILSRTSTMDLYKGVKGKSWKANECGHG